MTVEINEHHKVARLTIDRIFPALDEFAAAHKLTISPEVGVLVLLAQRLVFKGAEPALVEKVVATALKMCAEQAPPEDAQPATPTTTGADTPEASAIAVGNVLAFPKKK